VQRPSGAAGDLGDRVCTRESKTDRAAQAEQLDVSDRDLAPGEWAVLALLCEQPAHGWALARQLAPDGELGSIWSLGRPLVYRSLDILAERELIAPAGSEPGARGPNRTIFRATPAGRRAVADWLAEPVEHVREGRSLLLLKIVFAERAEVDPLPMLNAQHAAISGAVASLEARVEGSSGSDELLLRFRLESTRALLRFIDGILAERAPVARAV
jgi:PadR family transcriptional regulator AphA